jgi:hypothetical protein
MVAVLAVWVRRFTEAIERRGKLSQIEVEWRLEVFKQLGPKLNLLYSYFNYVGEWRETTPQQAIAAKRECDRIVHTNGFLWSPAFLAAYRAFTDVAFEAERGRGMDLALRANVERHRENPRWREAWNAYFVDPDKRIRREDFNTYYGAVLDKAVKDLGLQQ